MSVSNQTNKTYGDGNSITQTFSFSFPIFDATQLAVYLINKTTGAVTGPLTLNADYTVTISTVTEGGTVTFTVAPATGYQYFIKRVVPLTQAAVIPSEGTLPGKQIENQLDLMTMMMIQANEAVGRAIQMAITYTGGAIPTLPIPQANYVLGWDNTGTNLENKLAINADDVAAAQAAAVAAEAAAVSAAASAAAIATKATTAQAEAATDDTTFMTPAKVKAEVQKSGAVAIPVANVTGAPAESGQVDYAAVSTIIGSVNWDQHKHLFYKIIGKTVFVSFYLDCTTSNDVAMSFTLPFNAVTEAIFALGLAYDNSGYIAGSGVMNAAGNLVTLYTGAGPNAWTSGVRRIVAGQFCYQAV